MTTILYGLIEGRPGHANHGLPFYIGIGTAKRPFMHFKQARSKRGHRNKALSMCLQAHFEIGIEPAVRILGTYQTKDEACRAEIATIARYGRAAFEIDGILLNLASGGQGPDSTIMNHPDVIARISEASKNAPPEIIAARIAGLEFARSDPASIARHAEATRIGMTRYWADPVQHEKRKAALKGNKKTRTAASDAARRANALKANTPEANAKKGAASRALWADPVFRAKMTEKRKAAWLDPQKRENMLVRPSKGASHSYRGGKAHSAEIRRQLRREARLRAKSDVSHDQDPRYPMLVWKPPTICGYAIPTIRSVKASPTAELTPG